MLSRPLGHLSWGPPGIPMALPALAKMKNLKRGFEVAQGFEMSVFKIRPEKDLGFALHPSYMASSGTLGCMCFYSYDHTWPLLHQVILRKGDRA